MDFARLNFYSINIEALALKFDCVEGSNVAHKFPIHFHDSLCIGLITKGQRKINWMDKSEIVYKDEIFIINKNQAHAIDPLMPHDYIAITVKGNVTFSDFKNIIASKTCLGLYLQLYHSLKGKATYNIHEKWNKLYEHLQASYKQSDSIPDLNSLNPDEEFVRRALEYMQENYRQQISVNDIAKHSCVSVYHFCRRFKQLIGMSPHNYLRQYRINQSYQHLQNNTPVFDTAIETGFYDSSHFIKTFHSYMLVSPKEYQESLIKGISKN